MEILAAQGQEKAGHPHMDWGREMAYINHFYFYRWDSEWGAAFWKTNALRALQTISISAAMSTRRTWNTLRAVGESANRCLCDAEATYAQPVPDVATFCQVTRPSTTDDGLYAPGLRFGE